nr:hypothetical protein [Tanacetum cinerariifolium]
MSADVARGYGGDGGGDDRPLHTIYPPVARVASLTEGINGQLTDVDSPPDIIDVDKDDDFINGEDVVPRDLVDSNDEVLANDDDDNVAIVYSSEEED